MNTKHVFWFDLPHLSWMALGDTSVRILAADSIIRKYDLDAIVVPHKNPTLTALWERAFGQRLAHNEAEIPKSHRLATVSHPTGHDGCYGQAGWNIFEQVWWELGFFETADLRIVPPTLYHCDPGAKAAMVYPLERTDDNRVWTADWWRTTIAQLAERGYKINILCPEHCRERFCGATPAAHFPATVAGLEACVASSSLAIGGNTGPTWTCLLSDIPQIVLESHSSPSGAWFFDRCQRVLAKRIRIASTIQALIP